MTRGVWALCMAVALAACADRTDGQRPYSDTVAGWVGHSDQELIDDWGDPTEIGDAKGGKLLVYRTRYYLNNTNSWNYCTTRFQVDKKGKIVGTRIERAGSDLACTYGSRV